MFDITKLDKTKTYIGYQIGSSWIAKSIQKKSKEIVKTDIDINNIASHVFAVVYKDDDWYIYESNYNLNGVKKRIYNEWIKSEKLDDKFVYPYELNIDTLELYAKFNPGYSFGAIGKIATNSNDITDDPKGLICSEYIALAMIDHKPCFEYSLPPYLITPLHIQLVITCSDCEV